MTATLNEDIFTLIFSYIFDFEVLRATATAIEATSSQHPLRGVILRRLLRLPLRLSSERLDDSNAFISHLVRNVERAGFVQDIAIALGPSRQAIAQRQLFWRHRLTEVLKEVERAEAFMNLLPELLRFAKNLQRLDWSRYPPPNRKMLEELSNHSTVTHLSLDCSEDSKEFLNPGALVPDTAADIKSLLSTVGPKVLSLDLRHIDGDILGVIKQHFPSLKNVRNLKLDLTCGVWGWDGPVPSQQGPAEHYKFPRVSDHVQEFHIKITDRLAGQQKGPVGLVDSKKLKELKVEVISWPSWSYTDFVRLFSGLTPADLSSLTHLVIDDSIRDPGRWTTIGDRGWQDMGRAYVGIHELLAGLPQLRHLWVNERVLAIPSPDMRDDILNAKPFQGDSQDSIMSRTIDSLHWELLGRAFEKLETLRVGFGPLNANWVTKVLSHCDHTNLKAFGFDWEWRSNKPGVFSELIATLSVFKSLTDLHILHPYAACSDDFEDTRLGLVQLHESEEMKGLAKELLSELPGLYRVGIGRNSVWERQTRWREGHSGVFHVQRLHKASIPPFYDAGSSHPFVDLGAYDEYPAIKDVLKVLEGL